MLALDLLDDLQAESALGEARRRWGSSGMVSYADQYRQSRFLVGELRGGRFWIRGRGSSWEAAFADSDARTYACSRRKASH